VAASYDVLVDARFSGIALPDAFEQVERLYLWVDDYIPKLNIDLEGIFLSFLTLESLLIVLFSV